MAQPKNMNRRDVFRAAAYGASAGWLTAVSADAALAEQNPDNSAAGSTGAPVDIVIVGAGNAGIPAAIQAADLGASVVLVDKNPFVGGMLNISGGHISGANSKLQISKGIEDSPSLHYRDAMRMGRYRNNSELLKVAVDHAGAMVDWLGEIGVEFTPESPFFEDDHEHYSAPRTYMGPDYARSLLAPLRKELDKRVERGDISLRLGNKVTGLISSEDDGVTGVSIADMSGATSKVMARGVILATGGYGASTELKQKHNPKSLLSRVICMPHATGDGLVMAEAVGAGLVNMDVLISFPGTIDGASGRLKLPPREHTDGIWVNTKGERFVNEHADNPDERERAFLAQDELRYFYLLDEKIVERDGPGVQGWDAGKLATEVSRGVVSKAASVPALSAQIGVDASRLAATVAEYNRSVDRGVDSAFRRVALGSKLEDGPFYAIPVIGSILNCHGGLAVNDSLQVVDEDGRAIRGLYAVGEALGCGHMMGDAVLSGMSVGPSITLGRIVARNAYHQTRQQCAAG